MTIHYHCHHCRSFSRTAATNVIVLPTQPSHNFVVALAQPATQSANYPLFWNIQSKIRKLASETNLNKRNRPHMKAAAHPQICLIIQMTRSPQNKSENVRLCDVSYTWGRHSSYTPQYLNTRRTCRQLYAHASNQQWHGITQLLAYSIRSGIECDGAQRQRSCHANS